MTDCAFHFSISSPRMQVRESGRSSHQFPGVSHLGSHSELRCHASFKGPCISIRYTFPIAELSLLPLKYLFRIWWDQHTQNLHTKISATKLERASSNSERHGSGQSRSKSSDKLSRGRAAGRFDLQCLSTHVAILRAAGMSPEAIRATVS